MKKNNFILFLILCSCANHNIPDTASPNVQIPPNTSVAFVDLNGNFYPENWRTEIGQYKRTSSLYLTAKKNNVSEVLANYETKKLAEYRQNLLDKKRVFIFVHGYNNDAAKAKRNYNLLRTKIKIDAIEDGVIEFYWDGLVSKDPIGSGKIWFNATGYSQMAGEFGLRKILNEIHNSDIFIISHSRGASVVLSALSNPPYDPNFRTSTQNLGIVVDNNTPLAENGNSIVAVMLAPAVGDIDFKMADDTNSYRSFSSQLKKVHITVNRNDPALKKFIGLGNKFNPTTLGFDRSDYDRLNSKYEFFTFDSFDGQNNHSFDVYLNNPKFQKMVETYIK